MSEPIPDLPEHQTSTVPLGEPAGSIIALWFLLFAAATVPIDIFFCRSGGWGDAWEFPGWGIVLATVAFSVMMLWLCLRVTFRRGTRARGASRTKRHPISPEDYRRQGLGPKRTDGASKELYLDLVKRAVANILYQDTPLIFYDHHKQPMLAPDFDLSRRINGEDAPSAAHTMIGIRRLENIQFCIENVIQDDVPGDLVEAGVFRGGAAIFMRAVLKAYGVSDRRIFACDTFTPISPAKPHWLLVPIVQGLASIPSRWWRRKCVFWLQTCFSDQSSFPFCEDPSDDVVNFVMWHLRNPAGIPPGGGTSLAEVRSSFARYGLLDDQVVFLEGFFADTLPNAPLEQAAVIRLDGDTYESTRDAITLLYPKLVSGGYCIIDDYNAYTDCQRAVDEFRQEHGITDEINPIDNMAVFWRKT